HSPAPAPWPPAGTREATPSGTAARRSHRPPAGPGPRTARAAATTCRPSRRRAPTTAGCRQRPATAPAPRRRPAGDAASRVRPRCGPYRLGPVAPRADQVVGQLVVGDRPLGLRRVDRHLALAAARLDAVLDDASHRRQHHQVAGAVLARRQHADLLVVGNPRALAYLRAEQV